MPQHHPTLEAEPSSNWVETFKSRVGADSLETINVDETFQAVSYTIDFYQNDVSIAISTYPCATQGPVLRNLAADDIASGIADIQFGHNGKIDRWKKDTTIQWAAYLQGYPTPDLAVYAARKLNEAAMKWNSLSLGVKFKWVSRLEDAAFVLGYGGDQGPTCARAFFPNSNDINPIYVYKRAFEAGLINNMDGFFLHELGHVLGLHHEFAPENPTHEGRTLTFGTRNPKSVMGYTYPPRMQPSDEVSTKLFYEFAGTSIEGWPIQDWTPNN
ncbi:hypothetical protein N7532_000910 [Penicillium argentinense]|uniref:Peptidase metallopeptidase domain-containing protein n=1 Tax=Penicillium argentinense TaxID=1131581 RepID=A0A9W9G2D3_9EURO|nr:uncharacterized protein N7532_000910 [Penicillium argentinense]KAJ5110375.1 hypothetical protein N7532_000910 [Penicillium argentinense]